MPTCASLLAARHGDRHPPAGCHGRVGGPAVGDLRPCPGPPARPDLLVVGHRERGSAATALLEGTAIGLARRATRPVVVVKATGQSIGRRPFAGHVVVGVSHSLQAGGPLEFAFATAAARERALAVVHVGANWGADAWRDLQFGELHLESADPEWQWLESLVQPRRERYPRVPVKLVLHQPPTPAGLLRAARGAELVVVGTTGHGRVGAVGGSVSRAMIVHAGCPVAVLPPAPAIVLAAAHPRHGTAV